MAHISACKRKLYFNLLIATHNPVSDMHRAQTARLTPCILITVKHQVPRTPRSTGLCDWGASSFHTHKVYRKSNAHHSRSDSSPSYKPIFFLFNLLSFDSRSLSYHPS